MIQVLNHVDHQESLIQKFNEIDINNNNNKKVEMKRMNEPKNKKRTPKQLKQIPILFPKV